MKEALKAFLRARGESVVDLGCHGEESVDYPDFASLACRAVVSGRCDRGVLVCGTGIGMSIAANKIRGIRAALVHSEATAVLAAQHNCANVLCLGGRLHNDNEAAAMVGAWLDTPFESRHQMRLDKIAELECT